jgi:hypothetical protein
MRRAPGLIAAAAVLSFATVAATFGQTTEPQTPGQTTTIVGCLVQRPSPNADEFFVRTPAVAVPAGAQVKIGESPTSTSGGRAATSAGTPAGTTLYRVDGLTPAELKPHLNHRIELQGRLTQNLPPPTTATTTQDPKTGRATTAVKDDWTVAGVLQATSIKMVAASCQ